MGGEFTVRPFRDHRTNRDFQTDDQSLTGAPPINYPLPPTFHKHLLLCEEPNRVFALSVHIPKETILPTAEGEERHRCCNAEVNSNITNLRLIAELPRCCAAAGKQTRPISITTTVHQRNCIVDRVHMDGAQDGTKNLRSSDFA